MADINVASRKGGFITINTETLGEVLSRWKTVCDLAARLLNAMEDTPSKAAREFDVEELSHHAVSQYTTDVQLELEELVADLEMAVSTADKSVQASSTFDFHGHTVKLQDGKVTCETCSVPDVVCRAIEFMAGHNIRSLVVDGAPVARMF